MSKSPLRYPGGKTRACKKLDEILGKYINMNECSTVISPFFGGGSFEFYLKTKYNVEIKANDIFTPLYNFWYTVKTNKGNLCEELYKQVGRIDKEKFVSSRQEIMKETSVLNQSILFFIINRCSFSGSTLSGGYSLESSIKRFTSTSIDRIKTLDLTRVEISNLDFEEFIRDSKGDVIFLDPPYYIGSKLYGKSGDLHDKFDHKRLHNVIKDKSSWMLTYNDDIFIRELYKDFKIIETSWSYGMNKSKKSSEIVIISNVWK